MTVPRMADLLSMAGGAGALGGSIAVCLAMEAFFSGAEVALVSVDRSRIRRRAEAGSAAARRVQRLMERPERVLSTTLIGTNVSVVAGSFLANELMARRLGPEASAWAILLMLPLILLCGEILPKTLSRRHAETIALRAALPLAAAMALLSPAVAVMSWVARAVARPFSARARRSPFVTKEELRMILQQEHRLSLEKDEAGLIRRLLDFADARAREHMTPLVEVVSVPQEATVDQAVALIHEKGFSRIPVHAGRVDDIVGIVQAMDLIDAVPGDAPLKSWMKKPFYVPETARIDRVLDEFRRHQQEMAVVVDEYGSATGVLTLEDIVEQIVGDVLDEFDRPGTSRLERTAPGTVTADGRVRLDDLERMLDKDLPRAGYETVSGLVTHIFQRVPRAGESIEHEGLRITVLDASQRTVRRARIERL
ncbi:MAG TPA: hemolysin family protein [Candidatus Polarisedimenticolia bacterium]|nr:hemolysin family protein [Candidatus Polarisedimenticolia bacterium]